MSLGAAPVQQRHMVALSASAEEVAALDSGSLGQIDVHVQDVAIVV